MGKPFLKLTLYCEKNSRTSVQKNIEIFFPCKKKNPIFEVDINKVEKWARQAGYCKNVSNVTIKKIDFTQVVYLNDEEIKKYSEMKRIYNMR